MKYFLPFFLAVANFNLLAADIAHCSNPSGTAYFPETGIVSAKSSGWSEDKITFGITKFSKLDDNEYDILFIDARKEIISARQDVGRVLLLSRGKSVVSILVVYPGKTAEVYTFLKTNAGKLEYIHTQSRAGDSAAITKASVMRGDCAYINFEAL